MLMLRMLAVLASSIVPSLVLAATAPAVLVTKKVALPFAADPYPSTYQPLPRQDTLIVDATVLDGTGRKLEHTSVLLRDGRIAAVGAALARDSATVVIAGEGLWLTPGVIDVHSHAGNFPTPYSTADLKHIDTNEMTDPNTANVWAEHSITVQDPVFSRALAGGVTTLHVMPGSTNLFGGRTVVLKTVPATTMQAMKFPRAPVGLKMACGENPLSNYGDLGRFPSSRMGNVAGYREALLKARDHLDQWLAYERGERPEPPAADLKLDTLAGLLHGDLRAHVHCYRADDMGILLGLAQEFGFSIKVFHHASEAYKIAPLLARSGVCAAVWSDWWGYKIEALDGIRENAAFVDAAGGCVMMHSDSGIVGQRLVIEAGKAMAAGRRAGLTIAPEHAIEWVTRAPATALGLEDRIGTIEVGKNADVVIWSGDPFSIYSLATRVFIDGALVYDRTDPKRQPRSDFELGQPALQALPESGQSGEGVTEAKR